MSRAGASGKRAGVLELVRALGAQFCLPKLGRARGCWRDSYSLIWKVTPSEISKL